MPLPTFPTHLWNPASIKARRVGQTITGGESLSGIGQVLNTDGGGFWLVTMTGIALISPDLIRAWRAWEEYFDGGTAHCLVPIADIRQAPRTVAGGKLALPSDLLATSGDPYFPDAVGFQTPFIIATVVSAAPLRATQLAINVIRGARLKGGETFSLDHATKGRRMYRVQRVVSTVGQQSVVTIRPPLREAIGAGANADFDWPSCTMQLVPGTDISPDIELGTMAGVSIAFREAF